MKNCVSINLKTDKIVIKIAENAEQKEIIQVLRKKLPELKKMYQDEKTPINVVGKVLKNKEIDEIQELIQKNIDVTVDSRSEKIGYKIREARLDKLPYMLVVGQQEEADNTVSVRSRFAGDEGVKTLDEFIQQICEEIETKEIRKEEK